MATKTIKRSELSALMMGDGEGKECKVIEMRPCVMNYVGFGWVNEGPADSVDLNLYPIVED